MKRFSRGDFAITVNSRLPDVNDGHLVVVREVCGPLPAEGLAFAYVVERVDGEPFAVTCIPGTTMPGRGKQQAYAGQHHLRPLGGVPRWKARRAKARRPVQAQGVPA